MDISTVKAYLNSNRYLTIADALSDIRLIWDNCRVYNAEGSDIYMLADEFANLSEELIEVCLYSFMFVFHIQIYSFIYFLYI
jgi:hypothetical protein